MRGRSIRWLFFTLAAAACGTSSVAAPDDAGDAGDAEVESGAGSEAGPDGAPACASTSCALTCDPNDTWLALTAGPGTGLGDADPASPADVGDGLWHLFVGRNQSTDGGVDVAIFEATSPTPDGTFTLASAPLVTARDSYDALGQETPSYLRFDAQTEYLYYDAEQSPTATSIAAYKRVAHGAWTKVGVVAPRTPDEIVHGDETVVRDASTGDVVLLYSVAATDGKGGIVAGVAARTSKDPEHFDGATRRWITQGGDQEPNAPSRLALSRDDLAGVWRLAFDITDPYPKAVRTLQTWTTSPIPAASKLDANAPALHDGRDGLHPNLHMGPGCMFGTCAQGVVLQPAKAVYPNTDDVIFYYSGASNAPALQVNGQRCKRTAR